MNAVRNLITFKGTKEALDEVIAFLKHTGECELDFSLFVPCPEGLMYTDLGPYEAAALGEFLVSHTTHLMEKNVDEWADGDTTVRDNICRELKDLRYHYENVSDECLLKVLKEKLEEEKPWSIKEAKKAYENYKKYGYSSIQEWASDHWRTPSNAFCCDLLSMLKPQYNENENCYIMSYGFKTLECTPDLVYMAMVKKFPDVHMSFKFAEDANGKGAGYIEIRPEQNTTITTLLSGCFTKDAQELAKRVWRVKEK